MENIARPLERNEFNTLSAAMTMLALDVYARTNAAARRQAAHRRSSQRAAAKPISDAAEQSAAGGQLERCGDWRCASSMPATCRPGRWSIRRATTATSPATAIKNGLEIVRDYTDAKGNPLRQITPGQEIDVHVKIRATGGKGVGNVAIVDLLPGGFDPVLARRQPPAQTRWRRPPLAPRRGSEFDLDPAYTDVREDRVVIYGAATPDVQEFVYRIKASAAGKFIVPPAYGESMYDRRVQARAPGGRCLTVVRRALSDRRS